MLGVKKLDIFVIKSFILLFIGTFFICLFIFMMQFLWKYVDELVGKGLEMNVMAEFFFYSALTLVPAALPLAILLASLITFGNFGERYELLAIKAAGISLLKVMRPLIVFAILLSGTSFVFQNFVTPHAQVKLWTLLISMKQKSPELDIPEGVFYDEIEGYNLYVKKKNRDTGMLYKVMIYNFADGFENAHIIVADSGKLEMTADKKYLYLHLYSGELFENLKSQNSFANNIPYRRESFREKHTIIEFDAGFNMVDGSFMNDESASKNLWKLQASIDSMNTRVDSIGRVFYKEAKAGNYRLKEDLTKEDTLKITSSNANDYNVDSILNNSGLTAKQRIISTALSRSSNIMNDWEFKSVTTTQSDKNIRRHETEWHNKITLSLACLIFFFIGAPLGAIIRKGGLGMPVIISVLIFIIYYIINTTGYKMARDGKWEIWIGMWMSSFVLAPLGGFFTYKSNNDSVVLNADAYFNWFRLVAGIRSSRNLSKKDVVIEDPDYNEIDKEIDELSAECESYITSHKLAKAPNYYKLWINNARDEKMIILDNSLESIVERLSNSDSKQILNSLNNYPIIPVHAHTRPFSIHWLNILFGVFVPLGIFFYCRIWIFRIRLEKDLKQIIKTNKEIQNVIKNSII